MKLPKNPKRCGLESFQVTEPVLVLGGQLSSEGMEALPFHPSTPCPVHLFHLAALELQLFIINQSLVNKTLEFREIP